MMMTRRQVPMIEYLCNGCGKTVYTMPDDEGPPGWHGSVMHIDGGGGNGGDWYACSARCIRRAVEWTITPLDPSS